MTKMQRAKRGTELYEATIVANDSVVGQAPGLVPLCPGTVRHFGHHDHRTGLPGQTTYHRDAGLPCYLHRVGLGQHNDTLSCARHPCRMCGRNTSEPAATRSDRRNRTGVGRGYCIPGGRCRQRTFQREAVVWAAPAMGGTSGLDSGTRSECDSQPDIRYRAHDRRSDAYATMAVLWRSVGRQDSEVCRRGVRLFIGLRLLTYAGVRLQACVCF